MLTLFAAKEISHREFRGLCHQKKKTANESNYKTNKTLC